MSALAHFARAQRLHGQAYAAEADAFAARGDTESAEFYRDMAARYIDRAIELESEEETT